ncbi:MAG: TraB/GumN family protein [Pacificimonas sp.]
MRRFLLVSSTALIASCATAGPKEADVLATAPLAVTSSELAEADPALFVLADDDTTIYLVGTIHVLDGKQSWFDDGVKAAYDVSDEVVIEVIPPDPATTQAVLVEKGLDRTGVPLRDDLSDDGAALLVDVLADAGLPANAFDQMDPWFAGINLAGLLFGKMGLNPETGAEAVLLRAAAADGKSVSGLEEFEYQIDLFDTLSPEAQLAFLETGLKQYAGAENFVSRMVAAWADGDMTALADVLNEGLDGDEALRQRLLIDRNANWAEWMENRLEEPGTVFLAVGAGHLGGEGSVQDQLATRGLTVVRIDY